MKTVSVRFDFKHFKSNAVPFLANDGLCIKRGDKVVVLFAGKEVAGEVLTCDTCSRQPFSLPYVKRTISETEYQAILQQQ